MCRSLFRSSLIFIIIAISAALYSCGGGSSEPKGTSGGGDVVSGPPVGAGGNDADQIFRSLTIDPTDDRVVFVGSEGNGIFKSTDGGGNWTWLRSGLKYSGGSPPSYPEIYDMAIDPVDTSVVFAATTSGPGPASGSYPSAIGGVYKSLDGGTTWSKVSGVLPNGAATAITLAGDNLYLGLGGGVVTFTGTDVDGRFFPGGIFTSTNGGISWSEIAALPGQIPGADDASYWKIEIRNAKIFTSAIKSSPAGLNGFLKSDDSGGTWSATLSTINPVFFSATSDGTTIYASERDTFSGLKSVDSGNIWLPSGGIPSGPMKVSPANPFLVFYAQNEKLYRNADGMATDGTLVLPDAGGFIDDIEIGSPGTIYVGARGLIIWKSTDGGLTFTQMVNLRDFIDSQP
ncbi:MAG: glycoside hydrolase [Deltaproteobacteria bacterium]|nr:glycoside hydrolase [Deltaproteobacteria bacterium]